MTEDPFVRSQDVPRPPIKVPTYPPPWFVLWPGHPRGSAIWRLRRAYRICWWRRDKKILRRLLGGWLTWTIVALALAAHATCANGAYVRRLAGIGRLRQISAQVYFAVFLRIQPRYYYIYELYRPEVGGHAAEYITRAETKSGIYRALKQRGDRSKIVRINDKLVFSTFFQAHGLRAVPILAAYRDGNRIPAVGEVSALGEGDIFIKMIEGRGGVGAELWRIQADGRYRNTLDEERSGADILGHVAKLSADAAYLIQPVLVNHPAIADLTPGALSTARVVTILNESGEPEAVNAAFRMAISSGSAVDNFHAGGIAAAVDIETGRLGPATGLGQGGDFSWHDRHPVTGGAILGRELPDWRSAVALAVAAHRLLGRRVIVGWDVGFLPDGPCLVEGNAGPDADIHQRTERRPIGSGRYGQLLAHHMEKRLGL